MEVIDQYTLALELDPESVKLYYTRAKAFKDIEEYDEAIEDF